MEDLVCQNIYCITLHKIKVKNIQSPKDKFAKIKNSLLCNEILKIANERENFSLEDF